jgi:hypothetical protein
MTGRLVSSLLAFCRPSGAIRSRCTFFLRLCARNMPSSSQISRQLYLVMELLRLTLTGICQLVSSLCT